MSLLSLQKKIHTCSSCPRLREHCQKIAQVKKRAFADEVYWGKPVSGFGDPQARLLIVGLAPAAHGANRTGRMFTGDNSGLWLYRALHKAGFSNQPESHSTQDGLELKDVFITSVVKCAPPDNKPLPQELAHCQSFLQAELKTLQHTQIYLVLGSIALKGLWPLIRTTEKSRPAFGHGNTVSLPNERTLLMSYHPSQQNTFTRRLTEPMFDSVFDKARSLL